MQQRHRLIASMIFRFGSGACILSWSMTRAAMRTVPLVLLRLLRELRALSTQVTRVANLHHGEIGSNSAVVVTPRRRLVYSQ